jgi:hypothetical protein
MFGTFFALTLIMIKAPAPMLVAVGMYLPFETTRRFCRRRVEMDCRALDSQAWPKPAKTAWKGPAFCSPPASSPANPLPAFYWQFWFWSCRISSLTGMLSASRFRFVNTWMGNLIGLLAFAAIAYVLIAIPLRKAKAEAILRVKGTGFELSVQLTAAMSSFGRKQTCPPESDIDRPSASAWTVWLGHRRKTR